MRPPTLLVCRHGNTFHEGQEPYMVGAHEDLPLTEAGEAQARVLAQAFCQADVQPTVWVAGPLQRTRVFAEIVKDACGAESQAVQIDERLKELDFAEWSGKTSGEIRAAFGVEQLTAWDESGTWPTCVSFRPSELQVKAELLEMLGEYRKEPLVTCMVTSNGRIKVLAKLLGLKGSGKMGTGRCSMLQYHEEGWRVVCWNQTTLHSSPLQA